MEPQPEPLPGSASEPSPEPEPAAEAESEPTSGPEPAPAPDSAPAVARAAPFDQAAPSAGAPEAEPVPATDLAGEPEYAAATEQPAEPLEPSAPLDAPPRRHRGRTTTLVIASATVLGIVAGIAVGYGIQAQRPPTSLGPLAQSGLAYPAKALPADKAPAPLPVSQDAARKTEDLRRAILPPPAGASTSGRDGQPATWLNADQYANGYDKPGGVLRDFQEQGFRRAATATWVQGSRMTTVILAQFGPGPDDSAAGWVKGQLAFEKVDGSPLKGSYDGQYFVHPADHSFGPVPIYTDDAWASRGDVVMQVFIVDVKPVPEKDIESLGERQVGRL